MLNYKPTLGQVVVVETANGEFTGAVTTLNWLKEDQFGMFTGNKEFPVRVFDMKDVLRINGVTVNETEQAAVSFVQPPYPSYIVKVEGSFGNIYDITVEGGVPVKCTCKGFEYRGKCKHIDMFSAR